MAALLSLACLRNHRQLAKRHAFAWMGLAWVFSPRARDWIRDEVGLGSDFLGHISSTPVCSIPSTTTGNDIYMPERSQCPNMRIITHAVPEHHMYRFSRAPIVLLPPHLRDTPPSWFEIESTLYEVMLAAAHDFVRHSPQRS
jgi:hypothetical protein